MKVQTVIELLNVVSFDGHVACDIVSRKGSRDPTASHMTFRRRRYERGRFEQQVIVFGRARGLVHIKLVTTNAHGRSVSNRRENI